MSTATPSPTQSPKQPEKKFGPYAGGLGVAIWLNTIESADGRREIRSVTLAPRRYRDPKTGQWKDSGSYRPSDIPVLLVSLFKAMDYIHTTPLPERDDEPEVPVDAAGEIPF